MHIETQRILIRNYTMDDVRDLHDILGDAEVMENCEPAYSLEKTSDFISKFCIEKRGAIAAVHKDSGKMIGYILFNEFNEGVYEIGWFFSLQSRLITNSWRHTAKQRRHLRTCLSETENIIDEQKHIFTAFITEVFRHGKSG